MGNQKSIWISILKLTAIVAVAFSIVELVLYKNGYIQETIPYALVILLPLVVIALKKKSQGSYWVWWRRCMLAAVFLGICMMPWRTTWNYVLDPQLTEKTAKKKATSIKETKRTGPQINKPTHTHIGRELEAEQISKDVEEDLNSIFTPFSESFIFPLVRSVLFGLIISLLAAIIGVNFNKVRSDG